MKCGHSVPRSAYDQLKLRYEALEGRLQAVQQQLGEASERASAAVEMQQELERLQGEHRSLKEASHAANKSKDAGRLWVGTRAVSGVWLGC